METDSDTFPMYMKGICGELIVDSAENIPSNSSSEERDRGSLQAVVYAMDSSKVEVLDSTVAESQRNCCTEKFHPDCSQRIKELRSVFIGCGSLEEEELNVKGLMSEYTHEEPGLETSHQWEKDRTNVEPPKTEKAGVLGHCRNGVLPVYYVYKSSVIQLLKACDPDIQPGLLQCLEDTSERVTWNNSLSGNSGSVLIHKGQHFEAKFSCSNELDQCQKDQELEEVPCKQPDFCSDQAIVRKQHVVRRQRNNQSSTVPTTRIAIPQLSSEEIRIIVYTSFKDILIHRLQETSDLNLNENAVRAVSADIEKELFKLFYCTNTRYKNKYRSLMFNLKDPKNTHLFRQVLQGDITPQCLVLMSPTELASLELMEWRKREYKHSIKLTTTESDEFERKPLSKLTHKGEIEIEKDLDQNLTLEDLMDTSPKSFGHAELSVSEKNSIIDTTHQHRSHLLDPNCQICSAPLAAPVKSRVRRAKESCMASNLLNLAPDISVDERTLLESKCVSQMENTAGLPNPTKYPAAFKRFHPQTHAVWKGFIQMSNMKQFLVKAYPVLGLTDHLTKALSTTITVGKCVLPELIWDSVDRLHCSGKKEMCLVRFKPATRGDVCPYSLYYSYLNSRQKYGAVVLERKSPNSMYLIPLPALQKIPSRLPPLSGPGLESSHSDLLLALTFPKKQHSSSIFRKLYECRGRTDRYFQENKCRQKCTENINKEHLSDYSSAKRGAQPCTLPILPTLPFTQPRECQDKPLDLLSGNLLSTEEQSSSTDLADNLAVEICQSSCWTGQDQESDGIGNIFGASDFLDDWVDDGQNENFDTNELEHHVAGKESESMTRSKMFNIETNLLAHFKPADILPENFLCSETQLNSTLQQEDESKIERNELINDQEADGAVNAQYSQDMPTYIKELDKLFKNVPVSVFSQHEDCNQLHSTISCCAEVLNCLLSTSDSSLATELQIQMGPHEDQHNTTASQEGSEHIPRSVSPLPLHSPQIPNNFQHLGHSGTLNLEPRVPLPALLSDEVTMEQVEAPFQNRSTSIFPFKFNFYDETGIDAELHQLPRPHSFSPYCPIHHQHYTNVHMDTCQVQQCSQAFSHTAVIESRKVQ